MPLMDLGDVQIHYEERGSGSPVYVFCHGLGASGEGFERTDMAWYAERFRTVSWDNRGLGRSGQAVKYSLPLYASDLARLLDGLGIERAVLHGVSWGGVVVQRFALDFPGRCAALVLDSTSSEVNVAASENWYRRPDGSQISAGDQPAGAAATTPAVKAEHLASYVAQARATAGLREHPLTPYLSRITCPTLVVGGGQDTVAGAGGSVVIARNIPGARLEILQEAGHGVYRHAPEQFRALLNEFLAVHRLSPTA